MVVRAAQGKLAEGTASINQMCMVMVLDCICHKREAINFPRDAPLESSRTHSVLGAAWVQLQLWDGAEQCFSGDTEASAGPPLRESVASG